MVTAVHLEHCQTLGEQSIYLCPDILSLAPPRQSGRTGEETHGVITQSDIEGRVKPALFVEEWMDARSREEC